MTIHYIDKLMKEVLTVECNSWTHGLIKICLNFFDVFSLIYVGKQSILSYMAFDS